METTDTKKDGLYYEDPIRMRTAPKFVMADKKDPATGLFCGPERYRFSQSGAVRLTLETKRERRPLSPDEQKAKKTKRKTEDVIIERWVVEDIVDSRRVVLTTDLWSRMKTGGAHLPGVGWMFTGSPNPVSRKRVQTCSRCGSECQHQAGDSVGFGSTRDFDALLPSEWAVLSVPGKLPQGLDAYRDEAFQEPLVADILDVFGGELQAPSKTYILCSNCIPPRYTYCGWCQRIHRDWSTSEVLKPYDRTIKAWRSFNLPSSMKVREYRLPTKDRDGNEQWIRKPEHVGERIQTLIEYIGRATICESPERLYASNLTEYLLEMAEIDKWLEDQGMFQ